MVRQFEIIVFSDGENHCSDWMPNYLLSNALILVVPLVISIENYVSKVVLVLLSSFDKHQSQPEHIYKSAINMMICYILNTAGVILLVNFNIKRSFQSLSFKAATKSFKLSGIRSLAAQFVSRWS